MNDQKKIYITSFNQPEDPLASIKQKIAEKTKSYKEGINNESERSRTNELIKNMTDFVRFVEENNERLAVLKKSYDPLELDNGIGEVIMNICDYSNSKVNLSPTEISELIQFLQINNKESSTHYFENTTLKNIYLWYKKGSTHTEKFGEVVEDVFKGFCFMR